MSICPKGRLTIRRVLDLQCRGSRRAYSTPSSTAQSILSKPTWSVRRSLLSNDSADDTASSSDAPKTTTTITPATLRHLLRLSALPPPKSPEEEASMIKTLQSQLQFVQAVQRVDTEGVEPLTAVRDETREGIAEKTINLEALRPALEKEKLVGHYKRPKRERREVGDESRVEEERWDVLGTASRKAGKFFVVQSKKSSET